jgi:hypothetical protein
MGVFYNPFFMGPTADLCEWMMKALERMAKSWA